MKKQALVSIILIIIAVILVTPVSARGGRNPRKYKHEPIQTPMPSVTPTAKVYQPIPAPTTEVVYITPIPSRTPTQTVELFPIPTTEVIHLPNVLGAAAPSIFPFRIHWWFITPLTNLLAYLFGWA